MADTKRTARDDEGENTNAKTRAREGVAATASTACEGGVDGEADANVDGEADANVDVAVPENGVANANATATATAATFEKTFTGDGVGTGDPAPGQGQGQGQGLGHQRVSPGTGKETEPHASATKKHARENDGSKPAAAATTRAHKKPRLVWTPELHMRFMNAVNHLGIKNAVPKTILQLMNVEGMTRENVASHLQKYRLYLKRLAGLSPSAPLPNDIMQRAQPGLGSNAFGPNGQTSNNTHFMPTMEQMHAGVPPSHGAGLGELATRANGGGVANAVAALQRGTTSGQMPSLGAPPGTSGFQGLPRGITDMRQMAGMMDLASVGATGVNGDVSNMFPFGAVSGNGALVGVADPYGAAAQQQAAVFGAPGFGTFLNYMQGLHTFGGMLGGGGNNGASAGVFGPPGQVGADGARPPAYDDANPHNTKPKH